MPCADPWVGLLGACGSPRPPGDTCGLSRCERGFCLLRSESPAAASTALPCSTSVWPLVSARTPSSGAHTCVRRDVVCFPAPTCPRGHWGHRPGVLSAGLSRGGGISRLGGRGPSADCCPHPQGPRAATWIHMHRFEQRQLCGWAPCLWKHWGERGLGDSNSGNKATQRCQRPFVCPRSFIGVCANTPTQTYARTVTHLCTHPAVHACTRTRSEAQVHTSPYVSCSAVAQTQGCSGPRARGSGQAVRVAFFTNTTVCTAFLRESRGQGHRARWGPPVTPSLADATAQAPGTSAPSGNEPQRGRAPGWRRRARACHPSGHRAGVHGPCWGAAAGPARQSWLRYLRHELPGWYLPGEFRRIAPWGQGARPEPQGAGGGSKAVSSQFRVLPQEPAGLGWPHAGAPILPLGTCHPSGESHWGSGKSRGAPFWGLLSFLSGAQGDPRPLLLPLNCGD